jgi:hypothetical protein
MGRIIMRHDDYFSSELPDDPDAAFVVLEEAFRTEVLAKKCTETGTTIHI